MSVFKRGNKWQYDFWIDGKRYRGNERIDAPESEQQYGRIHGKRHHFAMREIDDAHHTEDHRKPERHQAVHESREQAADRDVGDDVDGHVDGSR